MLSAQVSSAADASLTPKSRTSLSPITAAKSQQMNAPAVSTPRPQNLPAGIVTPSLIVTGDAQAVKELPSTINTAQLLVTGDAGAIPKLPATINTAQLLMTGVATGDAPKFPLSISTPGIIVTGIGP